MIGVSLLALAINGGHNPCACAQPCAGFESPQPAGFLQFRGRDFERVGILAGAIAIRTTGSAVARSIDWRGYCPREWLTLVYCSRASLQEAGNILLEGLPKGIQLESVARSILTIKGVQEVHDIHVWTIGTDMVALSCHVRIPDMHMDESEKILQAVCAKLEKDFGISHITVQFERAGLPQETGYLMPHPVQTSK